MPLDYWPAMQNGPSLTTLAADVSQRASHAVGVVLTGSRARGDFDQYSDYDLTVVHDGRIDSPLIDGLHRFDEKWVGLRNVSLRGLSSSDWSQDQRHAYHYGRVLLDPKGIIGDLIHTKCVWRRSEPLDLFVVNLTRLATLCDILDNYKNCGSNIEQIVVAEHRGNHLLLHSYLSSFFQYLISLSLIGDGCFVPRRKVLFSDWIGTISTKGGDMLRRVVAYRSGLGGLPEGLRQSLKTAFGDHLLSLVRDFDTRANLPHDLYRSGLQLQRTGQTTVAEG